MTAALDLAQFRFPEEVAAAVRGKRVLITGAGRHGGLGQAFAFACGLSGSASVGVHFHRSYQDGLETVDMIQAAGGKAFPIQADVTSPTDVWATRGHVIRQQEGNLPDIVICNSGLSEGGYLLGRAPRVQEGESPALRRARARQAFVDNLGESQSVIQTKLLGFLATSHLWAGEAAFAGKPLELVFVSSRQALDPGAAVPGYVVSNWGALILPRVLAVNLGKDAGLLSAYSMALPFVRTGMTEAYKDNAKVFGRWQPRMLEPWEAAEAVLRLFARPATEKNGRIFQLDARAEPAAGPQGLRTAWSEVRLAPEVVS